MPQATFERLLPEGPVKGFLPLRLHQSSPLPSSLVKLLLLLPVSLALLLPFGLLALQAAAEPATRDALLASPLASLRIGLSLAVWAALFGWPVLRLVGQIKRSRTVFIDRDGVRVTEGSLTGKTHWTASLAEFDGLVHRIRASLSGTRHELILLHPRRKRSVLIAAAADFSGTEIARVASLLGQREIPASAIYQRRRAKVARQPHAPVEMGLAA